MANRNLSFRLLKEGYDFKQALKSELEVLSLSDNKKLFYGQAYEKTNPQWASFFKKDEIIYNKLTNLKSSAPAAVLFVKVPIKDEPKERWLIISFGNGFHFLNKEYCESEFGIICCLNKIDSNETSSIDYNDITNISMKNRTQSSKKEKLNKFASEFENIILGSITGSSNDKNFGKSLTGKGDVLTLKCDADYNTIDTKCRNVMDAFSDKKYQNDFSWYNNIKPIKDKNIIEKIDKILIDNLNKKDFSDIFISPPEIIDFQNIDYFSSVKKPEDLQKDDELLIEKFIKNKVIDKKSLTNKKVYIQRSGNESFYSEWNIYQCLNFEYQENGKVYFLYNGKYYECETDFVEKIKKEIKNISKSEIILPEYYGEKEKDYNLKCADYDKGIYYLDKDLIHIDGQSGGIEACDLWTKNNEFIHIKKRGNKSVSAPLSHLFHQGLTSGRLLSNSSEFRDKFCNKISQIHNKFHAEVTRELRNISTRELRNISEEMERFKNEINPQGCKIIFVFLCDEGKDTLPFFGKISFYHTHKQLKQLGYQVEQKWITKKTA